MIYERPAPGEWATSIWDEESNETWAEALTRFNTHGSEEVEADVALALIKAGYEVWSFGYGDEPAYFTCIDIDDVEAFEEDVEDAARIWGPFRFDESLGAPVAAVRFTIAYVSGWMQSPLIDPVTSYVLRSGLEALAHVGIMEEPRRTSYLGLNTTSGG